MTPGHVDAVADHAADHATCALDEIEAGRTLGPRETGLDPQRWRRWTRSR